MVGSLYLISTFAARHAQESLLTLQTWRRLRSTTLAVMIEESEVSDVMRVMRAPIGDGIKIIPYRYQTGIHLSSDEEEGRKRSPLFSQVWELMQAEKGSYDYLGFVNSDIEYHGHTEGCSIRALLSAPGPSENSVVLGQRIDYTQDNAHPIGRYLAGYDIFIIRSRFDEIQTSVFKRCRIGQVGWDYLIPLSQEKKNVCCLNSTSTYHRIHKTGSSSSWSKEIIAAFGLSHESWYRDSWDRGFTRSMTLMLYMECRVAIEWLPKNLHNHCKKCLEYVFARVFFYCFIRKELASIRAL